MGIKVAILSQSHLCRNPRVVKEAIALSKNGYEVHILNSVFSKELLAEDVALIKDHSAIRVTSISNLSQRNMASFADRLMFKLGTLLPGNLKKNSSLALGYGVRRYLKKSKALKADLYICHQEIATYIGTELLKAGCRTAFDLEDWYSADLLPEARSKRPLKLLQDVERIALNKGVYCTTTSLAMAKKLAETYGGNQPEVIYNNFPLQPELLKIERSFTAPLKLFWFSQTIGPGRGLEQFIDILKFVQNGVELHLLGNMNENYGQALRALLPAQHQIAFHPLVSDSELPRTVAGYDIGLALEPSEPANKNYTISNKLFHYLQAGLPVIATETAGQREIFELTEPGFMISQSPDKQDIDLLVNWLNTHQALAKAANTSKESAVKYSWENESKKLLTLVKTALEK